MSPFKSTQVKIPNVGLSIAWKIILFKNECNYLKTWVAWTAEPERGVRLSSLTIEDSVGRLSTIAWTHQISSELLYCGSVGKSVMFIVQCTEYAGLPTKDETNNKVLFHMNRWSFFSLNYSFL